jgi:hypothetical protein
MTVLEYFCKWNAIIQIFRQQLEERSKARFFYMAIDVPWHCDKIRDLCRKLSASWTVVQNTIAHAFIVNQSSCMFQLGFEILLIWQYVRFREVILSCTDQKRMKLKTNLILLSILIHSTYCWQSNWNERPAELWRSRDVDIHFATSNCRRYLSLLFVLIAFLSDWLKQNENIRLYLVMPSY